jgi:hypothetical protein
LKLERGAQPAEKEDFRALFEVPGVAGRQSRQVQATSESVAAVVVGDPRLAVDGTGVTEIDTEADAREQLVAGVTG